MTMADAFPAGMTVDEIITTVARLLGSPIVYGVILAVIALKYGPAFVEALMMVVKAGLDRPPRYGQLSKAERESWERMSAEREEWLRDRREMERENDQFLWDVTAYIRDPENW